MQQRVAALEQSVKDARAQIATNATTDKAARLALSAAALRDAVERGAPYRTELAQAKALGADDKRAGAARVIRRKRRAEPAGAGAASSTT